MALNRFRGSKWPVEGPEAGSKPFRGLAVHPGGFLGLANRTYQRLPILMTKLAERFLYNSVHQGVGRSTRPCCGLFDPVGPAEGSVGGDVPHFQADPPGRDLAGSSNASSVRFSLPPRTVQSGGIGRAVVVALAKAGTDVTNYWEREGEAAKTLSVPAMPPVAGRLPGASGFVI